MNFRVLLDIVGREPVFESSLLLAGDVRSRDLRRQLSRWVAAGRLQQLRRGLYALAPPYRKEEPHPFVVANRLVPASYVSLQSALSHHGLIPDVVQRTTSVTTGRPCRFSTPLGSCRYRHVHARLFFGYSNVDLGGGQAALVATPEKALLDLVHLIPGGDREEVLAELRLQALEIVQPEILARMTERAGSPRLHRACRTILRLRDEELEVTGRS
jgi:predicted transcriptional regulator of viral defense system